MLDRVVVGEFLFLLTLFSSSTRLFPMEKTWSFFNESIFSITLIRLLYNDKSVSSVNESRPSIDVMLLKERSRDRRRMHVERTTERCRIYLTKWVDAMYPVLRCVRWCCCPFEVWLDYSTAKDSPCEECLRKRDAVRRRQFPIDLLRKSSRMASTSL